MQQFRVGDLPAFGWLISFVDNGSLSLHDNQIKGIIEMMLIWK